MSGEVVDFWFVSKEEAQVKRYKKPLKDAAMKEKKEREAMEKWNKEIKEMEERKPMAEGVEPVVEDAVEVPELGVVPVAATKADGECAPVVPAGVKTVAQLKEEVAGDGVLKEIKAAPVEEVVGKVKKTNGALPWERKGDRGSAKVVAKALGADTKDMETVEAKVKRLLSNKRWRLNHLYWIVDPNMKRVRFKMNKVQEHLYANAWWRTVVPKSRRHGISTYLELYALDDAIFNRDFTAGLVDWKEEDGKKKLAMMKFAFEMMDWRPPGELDKDEEFLVAMGKLVKKGIQAKANESEIRFSNGSRIWTSCSGRGGGAQFLHISELGPKSLRDPIGAQEIKSGSINTVPVGGKVFIESTHGGGRFGMFYEFMELASKFSADGATPLDWKMVFYGWDWDDKNSIDPASAPRWQFPREHVEYFEDAARRGKALTAGQKLWWSKKKLEQGEAMATEFPLTMEEMLSSTIVGSVYGPIVAKLREAKRILDFQPDVGAPMYAFWDLGRVDLTCIWLVQFVGPAIYVVDYFTSSEVHSKVYVDVIDRWGWKYNSQVKLNFLPHDADNKGGIGPSWMGEFANLGMKNTVCVPRVENRRLGIDLVRKLLPLCYFHATNCTKVFDGPGGRTLPSGLEALESYRVEQVKDGQNMKTSPVHDIYSHGADAFRTMAEALSLGMLKGKSVVERSTRGIAASNATGDFDDDDDAWWARSKMRAIGNVHGDYATGQRRPLKLVGRV